MPEGHENDVVLQEIRIITLDCFQIFKHVIGLKFGILELITFNVLYHYF